MEGNLTQQRRTLMRDVFDLPDLRHGRRHCKRHLPVASRRGPALALFTAPRVDYSLHRLRHYTGTSPEHFQNFVLFTNHQFYVDEFIALGHAAMQDPTSPYTAFVEPGNVVTRRVGLPSHATDALGKEPRACPRCPRTT